MDVEQLTDCLWRLRTPVVQAGATFRRLTALDVDIACFGHGEPLVGGAGAHLRRVAAAL